MASGEGEKWHKELVDTISTIDSTEEERLKDLGMTDTILRALHMRRSEIFNRILGSLPPAASDEREEADRRIRDAEKMAEAVVQRRNFPAIERATLDFRDLIPQTVDEAVRLLQHVSHPRFLEAVDALCAHVADESGEIKRKASDAAIHFMGQRHLDREILAKAQPKLEALKTSDNDVV